MEFIRVRRVQSVNGGGGVRPISDDDLESPLKDWRSAIEGMPWGVEPRGGNPAASSPEAAIPTIVEIKASFIV